MLCEGITWFFFLFLFLKKLLVKGIVGMQPKLDPVSNHSCASGLVVVFLKNNSPCSGETNAAEKLKRQQVEELSASRNEEERRTLAHFQPTAQPYAEMERQICIWSCWGDATENSIEAFITLKFCLLPTWDGQAWDVQSSYNDDLLPRRGWGTPEAPKT